MALLFLGAVCAGALAGLAYVALRVERYILDEE